MNYRIPSIEEIYNQYHRETVFAAKGFYPRKIKNYDKVLTPEKIELLTRFQNVLKRNYDLIDWKLYIKACAKYFKRNFELKILGSLRGNKIYRTYVNYENEEKTEDEIRDEIISSLKFISLFCKDSNMKVTEYFYDRTTNFPIILKHLYSGAVSGYFYSIFSKNDIIKLFNNIEEDVFFELFNVGRNEFIEIFLMKKHEYMLKYPKLIKIINNINDTFKNKI